MVKVEKSTKRLALVSENIRGRKSRVVVKRQRTMSRVGKLGREMVTSKERIKAHKRRTMLGTK